MRDTIKEGGEIRSRDPNANCCYISPLVYRSTVDQSSTQLSQRTGTKARGCRAEIGVGNERNVQPELDVISSVLLLHMRFSILILTGHIGFTIIILTY